MDSPLGQSQRQTRWQFKEGRRPIAIIHSRDGNKANIHNPPRDPSKRDWREHLDPAALTLLSG
jgi:hypothetical protein